MHWIEISLIAVLATAAGITVGRLANEIPADRIMKLPEGCLASTSADGDINLSCEDKYKLLAYERGQRFQILSRSK